MARKSLEKVVSGGSSLGATLVQEPATAETVQVMERMKDLGVLMGKGGLYGNVFRIKPPMCFNTADADFLIDVMDQAMSEL